MSWKDFSIGLTLGILLTMLFSGMDSYKTNNRLNNLESRQEYLEQNENEVVRAYSGLHSQINEIKESIERLNRLNTGIENRLNNYQRSTDDKVDGINSMINNILSNPPYTTGVRK